MKLKLDHLNKEALHSFLAYIIFFSFISYLIISQRYLDFVVPRLMIFLVFMSALLAIFSFNSYRYIFFKRYKNHYNKYIPILSVLVLLGFLNSQNLDVLTIAPNVANIAKNSPIELNYDYSEAANDPDKIIYQSAKEAAKETITAAMQIPSNGANKTANSSNKENLAIKNNQILDDDLDIKFTYENSEAIPVRQTKANKNSEPIILNSENFYTDIIKITNNLDAYEGRKLIIDGFVLRDKNLYSSGDFYLARMTMTCCIADILPFGITCFSDGTHYFPDGAWIHVEGRIKKSNFLGLPQAAVVVEEVNPIEPISGYIYP